jgi:hypothetical protein
VSVNDPAIGVMRMKLMAFTEAKIPRISGDPPG